MKRLGAAYFQLSLTFPQLKMDAAPAPQAKVLELQSRRVVEVLSPVLEPSCVDRKLLGLQLSHGRVWQGGSGEQTQPCLAGVSRCAVAAAALPGCE